MNGETNSIPPVQPGNKKEVGANIYWALALLVIVVLAIVFLPGRGDPAKNLSLTSFDNIAGVQGIVRYVDYSEQSFVTERTVLTEKDGEYQTKTDTFNFKWDDNTKFLYYPDSLALGADQPWEVDQVYLSADRNVIVESTEKPNPEQELTAQEIKILPNSSEIEIVN